MTSILTIEIPDELADALIELGNTLSLTPEEIIIDALESYLDQYDDDLNVTEEEEDRQNRGIPLAS